MKYVLFQQLVKYVHHHLQGKMTTPFMDALLLIEPSSAAAYEAAVEQAQAQHQAETGSTAPDGGTTTSTQTEADSAASPVDSAVTKQSPTRFFGTAEIDPLTASLQFSKLVAELVELFSTDPRTNVRIRVDIEAESARGFNESIVRAARENGRHLGVKTDFE